MSTLSNQKATTAALIEGYNAWDIDAILAPRAPDCLHQVLPASMKREPASNEEYRRTFVGGFGPLFKNFKITVLNEIHDGEAHTCAIHANSTAETSVGPYSNEYSLFLTFTDDGTKIKRFDEFVDSAYTGAFFAKLQAAAASKKEGSS